VIFARIISLIIYTFKNIIMKTITLIALLGAASAVKISWVGQDASNKMGQNIPTAVTHSSMYISHFNGADEDEIMDSVFSHYAKEGRTPSGHKTGQKLLMKDDAKLAAGTILEAAHKLDAE
jgi:hypothetical protein